MTRDELLDWGNERCGVYRTQGDVIWCGPYMDAAVLDQVTLCWLTDRAFTAVWHLVRHESVIDRDDLSDRFAFIITPFFAERSK